MKMKKPPQNGNWVSFACADDPYDDLSFLASEWQRRGVDVRTRLPPTPEVLAQFKQVLESEEKIEQAHLEKEMRKKGTRH